MTRVVAALWVLTIARAIPTPAATTQTSVVIFSPWSSSGLRNGFIVSEKVKGSCWTHSLASERPDAWRCMTDAGRGLYDPCFRGSLRKDTLACAAGPFSTRVTLVTVEKPLVDNLKLTGELWGLRLRDAPWGLRLAGGDTCVFVNGATDAVTVKGVGERLNYACAKTGWIIGVPDRSSVVWTASTIVWPNKTHIKQVEIATAVF
jgi:hypothetical protein